MAGPKLEDELRDYERLLESSETFVYVMMGITTRKLHVPENYQMGSLGGLVKAPGKFIGDSSTHVLMGQLSDGGKEVRTRFYERENLEAYAMNNLTNSAADDRAPAWSPDGTKIAFVRRGDIFVMDADGSNPTNLTNSQSMDNQGPAWSPDGTRIAFSRSEAGGNREVNRIFVMDADGSNPTSLTDALPDGGIGVDFEPTWSPDGNRIAFSSAPDAPNSTNRDIFTLEVTPAEE